MNFSIPYKNKFLQIKTKEILLKEFTNIQI